jgi:hypothetical protein
MLLRNGNGGEHMQLQHPMNGSVSSAESLLAARLSRVGAATSFASK